MHFQSYGSKAFPQSFLYWSPNSLHKSVDWNNAQRIGHHLTSQAVFHLGEDAIRDMSDLKHNSNDLEDIRRVSDLISIALPGTNDHRRELISRSLVNEGLTLGAMKGTLELNGGASVLFQALDLEDSGGSQLRRGERLALIGVLAKGDSFPT